MIISASYRTDIPAFYGNWFMNRLEAGICEVTNPYNARSYRVSLEQRNLDGIVFWTKNIGPFLEPLEHMHRRGIPFIVQYTVNAYPNAIERSVPGPEQSIKLLRLLSNLYGKRAAVWRYDPVFTSDLTSSGWHLVNFSHLAKALRGVTDEVVVSFAQIYRKTRKNLDISAGKHEFTWHDPDRSEKETLAKRFAEIAARNKMRLSLCSQPELSVNGIGAATCIDSNRLSDVAQTPIFAKTKGNRPGCLCSESRDIGAYDSCPMGCAYCYAVRDRETAGLIHKAHKPNSAKL